MSGWVRNKSDGTVEAHFEGDEDAVAAMVRWTHEGPSRAEVRHVEQSDAEPEGLSRFEIR